MKNNNNIIILKNLIALSALCVIAFIIYNQLTLTVYDSKNIHIFIAIILMLSFSVIQHLINRAE